MHWNIILHNDPLVCSVFSFLHSLLPHICAFKYFQCIVKVCVLLGFGMQRLMFCLFCRLEKLKFSTQTPAFARRLILTLWAMSGYHRVMALLVKNSNLNVFISKLNERNEELHNTGINYINVFQTINVRAMYFLKLLSFPTV